MKKVLVLFLGMMMGVSVLQADDAPAKKNVSGKKKQQTAYVEVFLNDLSDAVVNRIAREGAMLKQAFMTYLQDGTRVYKIVVLSSNLEEEVIFLTEEGKRI